MVDTAPIENRTEITSPTNELPKYSENLIFILPKFQPPTLYVYPKEKLRKVINGSVVTSVTIFPGTDFQVTWIQPLLRRIQKL